MRTSRGGTTGSPGLPGLVRPTHVSRPALHAVAPVAPLPSLDPAVAPFGVYLHVPFCVHICRYCDFVTYAGREALIPAYVAALAEEIRQAPGRWPGPLPRVSSVFWGGGTPSLLPPDAFAEVHRAIEEVFGWRRCAPPGPPDPGGEDHRSPPGEPAPTGVESGWVAGRAAPPGSGGRVPSGRGAAEITVEANPETVDEAYWAALRETGVNRVSLGVQSFQPAGLRALDRAHDPAMAVAAVESARRAGIDNVSFDLIFGWAGQTGDDWAADLARAVALAPRHVSLYALTVEERTALAADIARGRVPAPDDDRQADLYEQAVDALDAAGYDGYEVSNWARREGGSSLPNRSWHNLLYWRNGEYLGFGVGAHSHFRGRRFGNGRLVRRYIEQVGRGGHAPATDEAIDAATAMGETMMLGLRLAEGVSRAAFRARHGADLAAVFGSQLAELASLGLLVDDAESVRLTRRGRLVANEVVLRFLPE